MDKIRSVVWTNETTIKDQRTQNKWPETSYFLKWLDLLDILHSKSLILKWH